jgi:Fe-S cluster assembly ATP-binding protein
MLKLKKLSYSVTDTNANNETFRRNIISNFNFNFDGGRFYAITGPNGSGKTTLAKLIMGINPVTTGSIIFQDKEITSLSITERAKAGIAYSFQHPARFKGITFRELLSIAANTEDETKLLALIRRVGICSLSFLDKPVDSKLSGGEIKKIELATTIALNPKLAIYDEPDTGIDLWTIGPMVRLLKKEQKQHETTTLVISHNRAFLEAADIILLMNKGKLIYTGNLTGALPLLTDLSMCNYKECGEENVRCFR